MSSAGLVRYFDASEESITIDPRTLLALCILIGFIAELSNFLIA